MYKKENFRNRFYRKKKFFPTIRMWKSNFWNFEKKTKKKQIEYSYSYV